MIGYLFLVRKEEDFWFPEVLYFPFLCPNIQAVGDRLYAYATLEEWNIQIEFFATEEELVDSLLRTGELQMNPTKT